VIGPSQRPLTDHTANTHGRNHAQAGFKHVAQQMSTSTPQALDRVATGIGYRKDILEKDRRKTKREKMRPKTIKTRNGIIQHKIHRISSVDIVWARCKNGG